MKTKKLFSIAIMLVISISSNASVYTVSNNPAGGAQYATLQTAYNAANAGDTLLIEGTGVGYTLSNDWNKMLTVIGIGFNPQKTNPLHAIISQVSTVGGRISFGTSGNGSQFYGLQFAYTGNGTTCTSTVSNYVFNDCLFDFEFDMNGQVTSNLLFINCVFNYDNNINVKLSASAISNTNISFLNCVFDGYIDGTSSSSSSLIFDHCLFLGASNAPLFNLQNGLIKNSIFMNFNSVATAGSINNTFTNNIARLAATLPPAGNLGSGNITSTNPNFSSYTLGAYYSNTHKYNLLTGSAAIGAASDGTDIGVHGGSSHFNESGEVLINPIIRSLNINNTSVAPNGNLNIDINATKPNDQ